MNRPVRSARWIRIAPDSKIGSRRHPRVVVVDDRRHPVVRADRQKFGLELVAATDVDRDHAVFEAALLEHDRDLPAVRRRPIIKIDHRALYAEAVTICAWILPSIAPVPKRAASAAAAALVAASSRSAGARLDFRSAAACPGTSRSPASRGDAARLRRATVSIVTRAKPAARSSCSICGDVVIAVRGAGEKSRRVVGKQRGDRIGHDMRRIRFLRSGPTR